MEIANSYSSDGVTYTFDFGNGKKRIFPASTIIIVDDTSGLKSIKNTATRKTMFLSR